MNPHVSRKVPLPLPLEAYEKYRGMWIALSEDRSRIIAAASDLETLEDRLVAAGENPEKAIFDRVEEDDICLGGAELL